MAFNTSTAARWTILSSSAVDAFAIPPLPLGAFERFHIAAKRVFAHFIEAFEDECEVVAGNLFKLFSGAFGQPDGPSHGVA
jgi:hypothetical protein